MYHYVNQYDANTIARLGTNVSQLIFLNPDFSNPDIIYPSQRIRTRQNINLGIAAKGEIRCSPFWFPIIYFIDGHTNHRNTGG